MVGQQKVEWFFGLRCKLLEFLVKVVKAEEGLVENVLFVVDIC